MTESRIAFFSRDAIVHELGGSTTAALNLLTVLRVHSSNITVIVTLAYSRSPRLFFRPKIALPAGIEYRVPGYLRLGSWYVNPFSPRAWARIVRRMATRSPLLKPLGALLGSLFGDRLVADAWDLTTPTAAETNLALREIEALDPPTVILNYAFWGPLLASPALRSRKRVILMHDLLSARIAKFLKSGVPLDCPFIDEPTELGWLSHANYVLAAQKSEAEYVGTRLGDVSATTVLVQPIVLPIHTGTRQPNPFQCLFVGTNIQPNITGIQWFLEAVWPLVLKGNPQARLTIAGTVCSRIEGHHPNVQLLGVLPSLTGEIEGAGVCIIPLLVGSGIKIKLLEALSFGKACVSTPIGVQGIEDWAAGAIDVASEPQEFAAAILRLMFDDDLRMSRERAAHQLILQRFSADSEPARAFAARVLGQ
jgi:glycosyltransferase involved in cell wall biosynthesis